MLTGTATIATANEWQQLSVPMVGVEHYTREVCLEFHAGDSVQYRFTSKHPVNFNIHYHPESGTEFKNRLETVQDVSDKFSVESTQPYCFTWSNKTEAGEEWDIKLEYLALSK
ncbi:hypothetical protein ACSV5M_18200 [Cellvibrio sp. ARAG 10.3]|uniref:hypothetical protein n=1 Tax=Cellvibrio sp. ARAG 10.3 TaxID=3451358 RepID=UPI003F44B7DA